ncbi:uncharacterized protein LOC123553109 isoform X2 [Mercenaria mercenaria]|uniref:uncharacterized protein LOC123553109 isoform X2 n=1 Tax=Mercenaria mercenaria TaxID=6596 RepID=UPI00234ED202|nr:uncharacterized protein LOC123553109 isoform X2 [Mercenaria mercenaria]XP_053398029.1 uncharacterized protein LOC123553109 isoform X2 [Mercenaria mercenaria]
MLPGNGTNLIPSASSVIGHTSNPLLPVPKRAESSGDVEISHELNRVKVKGSAGLFLRERESLNKVYDSRDPDLTHNSELSPSRNDSFVEVVRDSLAKPEVGSSLSYWTNVVRPQAFQSHRRSWFDHTKGHFH